MFSEELMAKKKTSLKEKDLLDRVRRAAERSVRERRITPSERRAIMEAYESGLRGYTYFED